MPQIFQTTEAIVLRVIPFRDYDQILFLFTERGLIKVIEKGGRSKSRGKQGLCTPLTRVEVIYSEKQGEIFNCHEMTLLDAFSFLRKELLFLEVACDLVQAILASQLIGKEAPRLYALLLLYLKKIPQTACPWILASSFRLKLLKHDGLTSFPFPCFECRRILEEEAFIRGDECWCAHHRPSGSQAWAAMELQMLYQLATCQNYREISQHDISQRMQNQIRIFFDACIKS